MYVNDARGVAKSHQLDFLDFVGNDGSIISSAEWPARFGYKIEWVLQPEDWAALGSFLMKVDTQEGPALALMAVARVRVGDKDLYVVGGERLGKGISRFAGAAGGNARAAVFESRSGFQAANLIDSTGPASQAERFAPIIEKAKEQPSEQTCEN